MEQDGDLQARCKSLGLRRLHPVIEAEVMFGPVNAAAVGMPICIMHSEHGEM